MTDARFEDAGDAPLNLGALDADDLAVLASLTQDAVFPVTEMQWDSKAARFSILLNRFRWEDSATGTTRPERVQSVLSFNTVQAVASNGLDRNDKDMVLSLLSIDFQAADSPSGHILLTLAGDGALRLTVEAVEATLKDVTRPYIAPSHKTPHHPD